MTIFWRSSTLAAAAVGALGISVASSVEARAPLNYFLRSAGPSAHPQMILGWIFTSIVLLVCIIVATLLTLAIFRRRDVRGPDVIGREEGGTKAVMVGTFISTLILFAMALYALVVLNQTAQPPRSAALTIKVTGYDWWWQADYPANGSTPGFVTANEIHIPVGQPVQIELESADVIHAFWVPLLAGKTQMIPGETNHQWLQADQPGTYLGQCTQFCGAGHARMAFMVVADDAATFERWRIAQAAPAHVLRGADAVQGALLFSQQCGGCHSVRGSDAMGKHAPDLTHIATRKKLAAGMLDNTPANLIDWVQHAQAIKLGVRMPNFTLSPIEQRQMSAYLGQLQ